MAKEITVGEPPEKIDVALSICSSNAVITRCAADIKPTVQMNIKNRTINVHMQLSCPPIDVNADLKAECKPCMVRLGRQVNDEQEEKRKE